MADDNRAAYLDGVRMLSRRELSEAQVRERLGRRQHPADAIDHAVQRLRDERALDDARVAAAIARTETGIRRRGKIRVRLQMERAGIARSVANAAIDEVFSALDGEALIEAALRKRLRGREEIEDDREWQRLFRFLIGQGFESDRVSATLRRLRKKRPGLE